MFSRSLEEYIVLLWKTTMLSSKRYPLPSYLERIATWLLWTHVHVYMLERMIVENKPNSLLDIRRIFNPFIYLLDWCLLHTGGSEELQSHILAFCCLQVHCAKIRKYMFGKKQCCVVFRAILSVQGGWGRRVYYPKLDSRHHVKADPIRWRKAFVQHLVLRKKKKKTAWTSLASFLTEFVCTND